MVSLLSLWLLLNTAYATSPCFLPSKQWFSENVIQKSDLVVYAEITDYSGKISNYFNKQWTDISVLKVLHGEVNDDENLTIRNWQAYYHPLYSHEIGDQAVFWLRETESGYILTDMSWKRCIPSIWALKYGESTYGKVINKLELNNFISLKGIEDLIAEATGE